MSDLYQEIILEEIKNPQHLGVLEGDHVISEHGVNASCGDEVTVYLAKNDQAVEELKWQGNGCAISMATMSLLAEKINAEQLSIEQLKNLAEADLLELLGLESISVGRRKCLNLGLRTIRDLLV